MVHQKYRIENPETEDRIRRDEKKQISHIQKLFSILYYLGLSPFKGDGSSPVGLPQRVVFHSILGSATVYACCGLIKTALNAGGQIFDWIVVGYHLFDVITICQYYLMVTRGKKRLMDAFQLISTLINKSDLEEGAIAWKAKYVWFTTLTIAINILLGILWEGRVFSFLQGKVTVDQVLRQEYDTIMTVIRFTPFNSTINGTESSGVELTPDILMLGGAGLLGAFLAFTIYEIIASILLIAAADLISFAADFEVFLNGISDFKPANFYEFWTPYSCLYKAIGKCNLAFNPLFRTLYIGNMLEAAYVMYALLLKKIAGGNVAVGLTALVRIAASYVVAYLGHEVNYVPLSMVNLHQMDARGLSMQEENHILFLKDMLNSNQLGLGIRLFCINESFVANIFMLVFTVVMVMVEKFNSAQQGPMPAGVNSTVIETLIQSLNCTAAV